MGKRGPEPCGKLWFHIDEKVLSADQRSIAAWINDRHQTQEDFIILGDMNIEEAGELADAVFLEVHDDPDNAKSDPATVYPLDQLEALLKRLLAIAEVVRSV